MMETVKTIEDQIDALRSISPNSATYLYYIIEDIKDYENAYKQHPEGIINCFNEHGNKNRIQTDINDLMHSLELSLNDNNKEILHSILENLANILKNNRPGTYNILKTFFKKFYIEIEEEETPEEETPEEETQYFIENLHISREELEVFYRKCDLEERKERGKGDHSRWYDKESGNLIAGSSNSPILWLRKVVKEMLEKSFSIDNIEKACKKLRIRFKKL